MRIVRFYDRGCFYLPVLAGILACVLGMASPSYGMDPHEVAEKFDYVLRKSHQTMLTKFQLGTCPYTVSKNGFQCSAKPRISVVENFSKFIDDDQRTAALILEPARERGIGMLNYEYYDTNKENSAWTYLPALNKIKRIISSQDSDDSGSFFGSEFYIEDLDYRKLKDYNFEILEEVEIPIVHVEGGVQQRPAWVLQWIPTKERARKTKYGKVITWIDKERYTLLKEELYDHNGQRFKERAVRGVENISNHWWPRQVVMMNFNSRRVSTMVRDKVVFDHEIPEEFLTQRVLIDQAFREQHLAQFRKAWN